jgi:hypothetical protein
VFPFALGWLTSTPAVAATPLMRGPRLTAVNHIPALAPVETAFPNLAESAITHSIKDNSREKRESKGKANGR